MKRSLNWKFAAAFCAFLMLGALSSASLAGAAKYVIKFSHGMPMKMASDQHALAVVFKNIVEAGSNGEIEVRYYEAGKLVPTFEMFDAVKSGNLDASYGWPGYIMGKIPALIADLDVTCAKADELGVFLVGIDPESSGETADGQ